MPKTTDLWHCPNGHVAVDSPKGRGCVYFGCEYRISNLTLKGEPRKRPGRKPKDKVS
jgi:hypothetical protein